MDTRTPAAPAPHSPTPHEGVRREPQPGEPSGHTTVEANTDHDHDHDHDHGGHGTMGHAHMWMMALLCLPLLAIGFWSLATGGGPGRLLAALPCVAMMGVMHLMMDGGHRH